VNNQFINILLVEDHPLYRAALVNELQQFLPAARILQAGSIAEAFKLIDAWSQFRLAILDLNLPDSDGLKSLLAIRQLIAGVPIAVISSDESIDVQESALQMGADVYINKSATAHEIRESIGRLIDVADIALKTDTSRFVQSLNTVSLSVRQQQVLLLLAKGMSNKEIAVTMDLADTTVRDHVTEILRRLESTNRTQAVVKAQQRGLLG
jgi:DNA-binding NarL/FixJ family response regulator